MAKPTLTLQSTNLLTGIEAEADAASAILNNHITWVAPAGAIGGRKATRLAARRALKIFQKIPNDSPILASAEKHLKKAQEAAFRTAQKATVFAIKTFETFHPRSRPNLIVVGEDEKKLNATQAAILCAFFVAKKYATKRLDGEYLIINPRCVLDTLEAAVRTYSHGANKSNRREDFVAEQIEKINKLMGFDLIVAENTGFSGDVSTVYKLNSKLKLRDDRPAFEYVPETATPATPAP